MKKEMKVNFNTELYAVLYNKFYNQLLRIYLSTHHSVEDAEDAVNDYLLNYCAKMSDGRKVVDTPAYIRTGFIRSLIDTFRKSKPVYFSQMEHNTSDDEDMPVESRFDYAGTDDADKRIFSANNKAIVHSCFSKMKAEDVNYLKLRFDEGFSNREIAGRLGQSADYVANRINRAKESFKKIYCKNGYERGDF